MWILQTDAGENETKQTFRLTPGAIKTVGRATRADFILDAALVSRLHCRLTVTSGGLEIEDLRSTNGTWVNDRRVKRTPLTHGDLVRIGRVVLRVERSGQDA